MYSEEELVPFRTTDLTGRKVLALAPHPDDETFGCGGSLALHALAGDPVKVVFLTNGAKGETSGTTERDSYVKMRQEEARRACECLGVKDLEFWGYEDRGLAASRGASIRLEEFLKTYEPRLVYAPSFLEFHPDHRAAASLLCAAIRACELEIEVAFYEVGQPLSVNCLVDITPVLNRKTLAAEAYASQLLERPYKDVCLGLNRFRSLTLPGTVTHAEAFALRPADAIRKAGPSALCGRDVGRPALTPGELGPLVSVIVRTKDRPGLLANAIRSIAGQTYANVEIVAVNDGGMEVEDLVRSLAGNIPVLYTSHETSRGRSAAANAGLRAARGSYLTFLDDDDVLYPDHVETLVSYLLATGEKVAYSSVLNVFFEGPPDRPESRAREELVFNHDFDPDLLLFENYIPNMSVLFSKEILPLVEGFHEGLVLFEDWDFWIRLSRRFAFHHVDKVTAEYRLYDVTSLEESHLNKYHYDEALAALFERVLPHLQGRAWVHFLSHGLVGRLRREAKIYHGRIQNLEDAVAGYQLHIQNLERAIADYQRHTRNLEAHVAELERHHPKHMAYRAYRKVRNLLIRS